MLGCLARFFNFVYETIKHISRQYFNFSQKNPPFSEIQSNIQASTPPPSSSSLTPLTNQYPFWLKVTEHGNREAAKKLMAGPLRVILLKMINIHIQG